MDQKPRDLDSAKHGGSKTSRDSASSPNRESFFDALGRHLAEFQGDVTNKAVGAMAHVDLGQKFSEPISPALARQYLKGRDIVAKYGGDEAFLAAQGKVSLSESDHQAVKAYQQVHQDLPAKIPLIDRAALLREVERNIEKKVSTSTGTAGDGVAMPKPTRPAREAGESTGLPAQKTIAPPAAQAREKDISLPAKPQLTQAAERISEKPIQPVLEKVAKNAAATSSGQPPRPHEPESVELKTKAGAEPTNKNGERTNSSTALAETNGARFAGDSRPSPRNVSERVERSSYEKNPPAKPSSEKSSSEKTFAEKLSSDKRENIENSKLLPVREYPQKIPAPYQALSERRIDSPVAPARASDRSYAVSDSPGVERPRLLSVSLNESHALRVFARAVAINVPLKVANSPVRQDLAFEGKTAKYVPEGLSSDTPGGVSANIKVAAIAVNAGQKGINQSVKASEAFSAAGPALSSRVGGPVIISANRDRVTPVDQFQARAINQARSEFRVVPVQTHEDHPAAASGKKKDENLPQVEHKVESMSSEKVDSRTKGSPPVDIDHGQNIHPEATLYSAINPSGQADKSSPSLSGEFKEFVVRGRSEDKYITGTEFAFVAIMALASAARARPSDNAAVDGLKASHREFVMVEEEQLAVTIFTETAPADSALASASAFIETSALAPNPELESQSAGAKPQQQLIKRLENAIPPRAKILLRPQIMVQAGDDLAAIGEALFHDSRLGHLIADLNVHTTRQAVEQKSRVVILQTRQKLSLPVYQDIMQYTSRLAQVGKIPLITIVESTAIDKEVLDEGLARLIGLDSKNVDPLQ